MHPGATVAARDPGLLFAAPTRSFALAAVVVEGGDLSASANARVGGFVAVYSGIFADRVHWRRAPRPEGPWSDARALFDGLHSPGGNDYAGKEHPELASDGGRALVVSYARPLGGFDGEVRLAAPRLP